MEELSIEVDANLAVTVLEEAGRLCAERLHPLNWPGDEQGSTLVNGAVQTPDGFAEAYREFVAAGWPAMSAKPEYGGQGLPFILQLWLDEMRSEEHTSELQSLMRISYAVFCLKKKKRKEQQI